MRTLAIALMLGALSATVSTTAWADSCKATAAQKKLAGAALNSFMKKCQNDAQTSCNTQATEKKLNGAARTSFTKKCVNDAVGS